MNLSQTRDNIASFGFITDFLERRRESREKIYKAEYLEREDIVPEKEIATADKLDYIQIDNLNKATLNFSGHSLETKKLCVTVLTSVITILLGVYKDNPKDALNLIRILGLTVVVIFYIVDCILYWYQDKLRNGIIAQENNIRKRHNIKELEFRPSKKRVKRSMFNGSNFIYLALGVAVFGFTTFFIFM